MTQKLLNLIKEWRKYWNMFNDKQVFDDGQFYPMGPITVVQVSSSIEPLKFLL
jgi:hypothetical protein